jgi:peroxiredoxin
LNACKIPPQHSVIIIHIKRTPKPMTTTKEVSFLQLALMLGLCTPSLFAQFQRTDIHDQASQVQPLLPGMSAPKFDLLDAQGRPVHFDPEKLDKPLVLSFYRGGWCPYCNLHLAEMRKAEAELTDMGFDIWFISIDQPELLYESLQDPDIGYTVLSDSKLSATRAFGLAFRMPDDMVKKYLEYGIDLEGSSGETHHVLPAPATFIIGTDGIIQFQYTNPDYKVRLHPDVLLAAAHAYTNGVNDRLQRQYKAMRQK